jgi:hypothetical protein
MATNDYGLGSMLANFENAYSNKANRKYTQAQTAKLEDENTRRDLQNIGNEVVSQGIFGVVDGGLSANVNKFMGLSDELGETYLNAGNRLNNYVDSDGKQVQGYLLKPKVLTTTLPNGDKVTRYGLQIRDKNGDIKAVTVDRGTGADERPMLLDAEGFATVLEAQQMNLFTKGGIDGAAYATLAGLNFENSDRNRIQKMAGDAIGGEGDGNPNQLTELLAGAREALNSQRKEGEIVDADGGEDIGNITAKQAVNTGADGSELPGAKQMALEEDMSRKPITNMQEFVENSPSEVTALTKALKTNIVTAKKSITDELLKQTGYFDADDPKYKNDPAKAAKKSIAKNQFIKDFAAQKEGSTANPEEFAKQYPNQADSAPTDSVPTVGVEGVTDIPVIPTDKKGIAEWFNNPENIAALQAVQPESVEKIQTLLEDKNINSKADLIKAATNEIITQGEFRQVALLIAYSYNGGKSVPDSRALYSDLINEAATGSPSTTADNVRNTNIRANELQNRINEFAATQGTAFSQSLSELFEAAVTGKEGAKKTDYKSPEFIAKLKGVMPMFLGLVRSGKATTEQLELMDSVMAEAISFSIGGSSEGIIDAIGDLFLRGDKKQPTLGSTFDNFQIVYDQTKKKKNGEPLPIRIEFTNTVGSNQYPSDQSMDWEVFTGLIGQGEVVNYIEQRAKKRK